MTDSCMSESGFSTVFWITIRLSMVLLVAIWIIGRTGNGDATRQELDAFGIVVQEDEQAQTIGVELLESQLDAEVLSLLSEIPTLKTLLVRDAEIQQDFFETISTLTKLKALYLYNCRIEGRLPQVADGLRLRGLCLSGSSGQDLSLADFQTQSTLEQLDVSGCRWFDDEDAQVLRQMPGLQVANLSETKVSDRTAELLADNPNLHHLNLTRCQITDETLNHISKFPGLRKIVVKGIPLSLTAVAACRTDRPDLSVDYSEPLAPDLQQLAGAFEIPPDADRVETLTAFISTPGDFDILRHLASLRSLKLHGPGVNDTVLRAIRNLHALTKLDLSDSRISDAGFQDLPAHPMLNSVTLSGTAIGPAAARWLSELPRLHTLSLSRTILDPALSSETLRFRRLYDLDLSFCLQAANFLNSIDAPDLAFLTLEGCQLSHDSLPAIDRHAGLVSLDVSGNSLSGSELQCLVSPDLQELVLQNCGVTDDVLTAIAMWKNIPRRLDLSCNAFTGSGFRQFRPDTIITLSLRATQLNDGGLAHLATQSALKSLDLRETQITATGSSLLCRFPALSELLLDSPPEPLHALLACGESMRLKVLGLTSPDISTLRAIQQLHALPCLRLENAEVTEEMIPVLAETRCDRLILSRCSITSEQILALAFQSQRIFAVTLENMPGTSVHRNSLMNTNPEFIVQQLSVDQ